MAADQQKNQLGVADSAHTNGQSGLGYLVGVATKKAGVDDQSVLSQGADAGTGYQGGDGLIESDVAVHAGTAQEQIDAAVGSDLVLIALALCFQILSHAVEDVDILSGDVDVVEEVKVYITHFV